ncbi:MAG: hypothetical protein L6V84_02960 [Oscillospiraceae bacterium]|nr:MAG: hypothetical protein L6V84_02960 [Oscillospiraceae bacterium]
MAVHMLCDTCGRKKAAVFYHENIGGRVRTFNLCPACADAMKKSGELEDFSDACAGPGEPVLCPEEPVLHELPIPAAVGTDGAPGLLCPRCGGSLSDLAASGEGGMRGMLHGICRGACAAPADLRRAALSRGSRSGRLSYPAGAGGTCGGTPAGAVGGCRGRAF